MRDVIIKILGKYVYGRPAYPDIANAILKKFAIEIDSCMNDISNSVYNGERNGNSSDETATDIINIVKNRIGGTE